MPSPARTSREAVVAAARRLLEEEGIEAVTMQRVAEAVGVRPPSLYKHVRDHADLMHRLSNEVATELAQTLDEAATHISAEQDLMLIARAFRAWVVLAPGGYTLLTSAVPDAWRVDADLNARTSAAIVAAARQLVGAEHTLDAARTFVAFVHGFVSLELAGTFRLGGDLSGAYEFGISALISAVSRA